MDKNKKGEQEKNPSRLYSLKNQMLRRFHHSTGPDAASANSAPFSPAAGSNHPYSFKIGEPPPPCLVMSMRNIVSC